VAKLYTHIRHPVQSAIVGLYRIIFLKYTISVVENSNITSVFGIGLENLVSASALASSFWPQLKHLASFTISDINNLIHKCTNYLLNITQQSDEQRECR